MLAQIGLVEEDVEALVALAPAQVGPQAVGLAPHVVVAEAERAAEPVVGGPADAIEHAARVPLLDADQHVALRLVEAGGDELHLDAGEDPELVEVALVFEQLRLADRLAVSKVERAADHLPLRALVAPHQDAVHHLARALEHLEGEVHQGMVRVPVLPGGDLGLVVPQAGVLGADEVQRVVEEDGVEPTPLPELEALAQLARVERRDSLEVHLDEALARTLADGDDQPEVLLPALDPGWPDGRLRIAFESVVAAEVVEVGVEVRLDQPAAPRTQEITLGGLEQLAQLRLGNLLVPLEDDLGQGVDGAGTDAQGEHELPGGLLLARLDLHVVMSLLLVVGLDAVLRLEHQSLVVAGVAEEGEQAVAPQSLLVGTHDDERDLGADRGVIGELDGVARGIVILMRRRDPRLPVLLTDQPGLEMLGVLRRDPPAERLAGLQAELADELGRLEGCHGFVKRDGAHGGPGAAVDVVGDDGAAAHRIGLDGDAGPGVEVAVALVELLQGVDAAHHPLFGERLRLALGDGAPQVVARHPQLAGDADLRHLHDGAEDDHHDHPSPGRVVPRVELDLRGRAARLEVAQGVTDVLVGQRLADLHLDQGLEVERRVEGGVAADLDGGDGGARARRGLGGDLRGGRRRTRSLAAQRRARQQGESEPGGRLSPSARSSAQSVSPQKRRCHWASTA